jgi:hypothetical protein
MGGRSKDITTENCKLIYKYEQRIAAVFEVKSGIYRSNKEGALRQTECAILVMKQALAINYL